MNQYKQSIYLITSQARVKRVSRIHHQTILEDPSCYWLKFIYATENELWETANFVYNLVQKTNSSTQLWWQIWPTFFLWSVFLCGFHTRFLFTFSLPWCKKKSKMTKSQIKWGGGGMHMLTVLASLVARTAHIIPSRIVISSFSPPTDIDECSEGTHNCPSDAMCVNSFGSFDCRCKREGHVIKKDDHDNEAPKCGEFEIGIGNSQRSALPFVNCLVPFF